MIFPSLAPNDYKADGVIQMNRAAEVLKTWTKPAIILFSDKDEILGKMVHFFTKLCLQHISKNALLLKMPDIFTGRCR